MPPANNAFVQKLKERISSTDSLLCVGLDPVVSQMPGHLSRSPEVVLQFCQDIVEATLPYAAAYKPNLGFFVALGRTGLNVLWALRHSIPADVPVILDAKVNDMGETGRAYARGFFDEFEFDALTVNPYLGEDAVAPYMEYEQRGVLVLCKTSNSGSGDLQDLKLEGAAEMYLTVADRARDWQTQYPADVGLVVGATYPSQLASIRQRCPDQLILMPGVGVQGGDLEGSIQVGLDRTGAGLLCSASRAVMYASPNDDYIVAAADVASDLLDQIRRARSRSLALANG